MNLKNILKVKRIMNLMNLLKMMNHFWKKGKEYAISHNFGITKINKITSSPVVPTNVKIVTKLDAMIVY